MKKTYCFVVAACLLALTSLPAQADPGDISLGLKAGTLGGGIEATMGMTDVFNVRIGANYLTFTSSETVNDVDYDLDLDFNSLSLLLDWHPLNGIFRITGGAMINGNELALSGKSKNSSHIGDHDYSAAQIGTITGTMEFDEFAPYLGIGWSTVHPQEKGWGIALDLGVLFQGSPTISSLTATGPLAGNAAFLADLEKEKQEIEDDIDSYRYYPVVSVIATYKF